jgi:neutral ceramidase
MKNKVTFLIIISLMLYVPFTSFGQNASNDKMNVKIGVSQVNITPETPTLMSGYSARTTPFTRVHDELFASALLFSNDKNKILIITADLIGFSSSFIDEVKKMISAKTEIPVENIMITAVHNHGGPVTKVYEKDMPKSVEDYVNVLREKLTNLAVDASKNLIPCKMGIGKGTCNMNINRRAEFADGSIGLGRNPDGPCDHELVVVKFEDMNNKTLAVLLNWPCHGTTSGQDNTEITGDWPGGAARYIKNQSGKDVIVAVTAGASADINPIYGPGKSFKEIEAVGYHVGVEACKTIAQITTFPIKTIQSINSTVTFPGKKSGNGYLPATSYESAPDVEIRLTTLKIGDLVLSGISGELMNEIGVNVKKQSPYSGTLIVTHCNGSSGYICTDKAFPEGGYEVSTTRLMPGSEKQLTKKMVELIHSL